jgi:hypothetical protein
VFEERPWLPIVLVATAVAAIVVGSLLSATQLRVALFGFAGTLIGAFTTFEATDITARRGRKARTRSAGRLLQEELLFARTRCLNAQRTGKFWGPRFDLRISDWEDQREIVSQELSDTRDWQSIVGAFEAMRSVQAKCNALRDSGKWDPERPGLGPNSRRLIADYLDRSEEAMEALRRLSGDRPPDEVPVDEEP